MNPIIKSGAVLVLLASMLVACDKAPPQSPSKIQQHMHVVEVVAARIAQVQNRLTATGTIEAATIVRLYNKVSSRITYLPNHEGDAVAAHSELIDLNDAQI